jgi:hypothetical protein
MNQEEIDKYESIIQEDMEHILDLYHIFADKKPIMQYVLPDRKIYTYPYLDFLNDLNEKKQNMTLEQYMEIVDNGQFVVFVKDSEKRKLYSFVFNL